MANRFAQGERVEVIGADDGLVGSYHEAVVTRHKREYGFVKVRYSSLVNDSGGALEEVVPTPLLRPLPPTESPPTYREGDHVDFFNRNGWWYGIVRERRGRSKYLVDFSGFGYENVECEVGKLRPHYHGTGSISCLPPGMLFTVSTKEGGLRRN